MGGNLLLINKEGRRRQKEFSAGVGIRWNLQCPGTENVPPGGAMSFIEADGSFFKKGKKGSPSNEPLTSDSSGGAPTTEKHTIKKNGTKKPYQGGGLVEVHSGVVNMNQHGLEKKHPFLPSLQKKPDHGAKTSL